MQKYSLIKSILWKICWMSPLMAPMVFGYPLKALSSPFQSQGPFVIPEAGTGIPTPRQVPGKEFTDSFDRDAFGNLDSLQVIAWDGAGGTADSFDYDGVDTFDIDLQVDALANLADTLFLEVIADSSALLFSVQTDSNIYAERVRVPVSGLWASVNDIDDMNTISDLDALEVWGLDGPGFDDSDRFSLLGDPVFGGLGKVSVFAYDSGNQTVIPYITAAELANAIGVPESLFDLDGLMTFDLGLNAQFENGDLVLFSVQPIDIDGDGIITENVNGGDIDGGEIWVYEKGVGASFLFHGGHLWDTAFNVSQTYNLPNENIDALEAVSYRVPEPSSLLSLAIVGGLGFLSQRQRRQR